VGTRSEEFLAQARSDFEVFRRLAVLPRDEIAGCHPMHYLQMAIEEFCKALKYRDDDGTIHLHSMVDTPNNVLRNKDCLKALGYGWKWKAYCARLTHIMAVLRGVECLHPSVAQPTDAAPNLEYPWALPPSSGDWTAPSRHAAFDRDPVLGPSCLATSFVERLMDRFCQLP